MRSGKRQQKQPPATWSAGMPWDCTSSRVHQVVALIVQHDGDAHAARCRSRRGGENQRGLPCPEKAADHRDDGLHTRRSSPSFNVALGVRVLAVDGSVRHSSVP